MKKNSTGIGSLALILLGNSGRRAFHGREAKNSVRPPIRHVSVVGCLLESRFVHWLPYFAACCDVQISIQTARPAISILIIVLNAVYFRYLKHSCRDEISAATPFRDVLAFEYDRAVLRKCGYPRRIGLSESAKQWNLMTVKVKRNMIAIPI